MMGQCVGGYCDYVGRGETKIYSLRDPKGGSHVTVEVRPATWTHEGGRDLEKMGLVTKEEAAKLPPDRIDSYSTADLDRALGVERGTSARVIQSRFEKLKAEQPDRFLGSIQQIKGKQNRAPAPEYLPYVQDFVKSGKWGKVRDLANADLRDINTLSDRDPAKPLLKARYPDKRYLTTKEMQSVTTFLN